MTLNLSMWSETFTRAASSNKTEVKEERAKAREGHLGRPNQKRPRCDEAEDDIEDDDGLYPLHNPLPPPTTPALQPDSNRPAPPTPTGGEQCSSTLPETMRALRAMEAMVKEKKRQFAHSRNNKLILLTRRRTHPHSNLNLNLTLTQTLTVTLTLTLTLNTHPHYHPHPH
jgi:hypothetical protein